MSNFILINYIVSNVLNFLDAILKMGYVPKQVDQFFLSIKKKEMVVIFITLLALLNFKTNVFMVTIFF